MSTDTLSDVLRAVRLRGAIFFSVEASAPWVAEAPAAREVARRVLPGADHVIEYHVVTAGGCWAAVVGEDPVRVEGGDVVVFPQGDPHVMSSAPGMRGQPDLDMHVRPDQLPAFLDIGGTGERAHVMCGFLGCDATPFNPLLATLPRMMVVRRGEQGDVLDHLIGLTRAESLAHRDGGECVLSRLSELMFIEVVRRYLAALPSEKTGWLAGLRDPHVGRALGKLHHRPAADWTLDELAREAGLSRSAFADRFVHFVGMPPMQYLAQWRMQLAATLLMNGSVSLAQIAAEVGYGSEAALSRAFKRYAGVAPALWRERRRSDGSRSDGAISTGPST